MRILFVHQNFPGQYRHVASALARDPRNDVAALQIGGGTLPGVRTVRHTVKRGSTSGIHPLAQDFESKMIRGESAARTAFSMRAEGFVPDIICGHPGWGETLFLKDVWPDTPILSFFEFAYRHQGADVGFDPEFPLSGEEAYRVRSKNASILLALASSDWLVTPTKWQGQQLPPEYQDRLSIIHDGIDTKLVSPNCRARIALSRDGLELKPGDEVVTFVNRNLEPYRGYHTFMRALPAILRQRPNARAVLVGGDGVSYGAPPASGKSYRSTYLSEVETDLDISRVHFVGTIPYNIYLQLLQISAAHVYLTYPFVLSWSLLEAMSVGCAVVGSSTQPVQEVITDGRNGILVDFLSPEDISTAVIDILARPDRYKSLRACARHTIINQYDLNTVCLPAHIKLINDLMAR